MEIVTKVKERFEKRGIHAIECSSIDPETGEKKTGFQFDINDTCDVIVYAKDYHTEYGFYELCKKTLQERIAEPQYDFSYTADIIVNHSHLMVKNITFIEAKIFFAANT